jgi:tetratricopeptide (TPR) repeat protein
MAVRTRNGQGGANTGVLNLTETLGNPADWTDQQVVDYIEQQKPAFQLVALLRLNAAQTEWQLARGYRHLARARELSDDWYNAMVNWRNGFRVAWRNNFHTLTMGYLSQLAYTAHKAHALHIGICYARLLHRLSTDTGMRSYASMQLARCLYDLGDFEGMLEAATASLDDAPTDFHRTSARLRVSCALNRLGRYDLALDMARCAYKEYVSQRRDDGSAWALTEVARALCGLRRYQGALYAARIAREAARRINDETELGRIYGIVGTIHVRMGDHHAAHVALRRARRLLASKHSPSDEIEVVQELAAVIARRQTA